ncbi:hypothetical protein BC628DRAFT_502388 [Trametes gibbosa]|nr:hypothetical protein BC628DRAFT_502388 [Trametes gibbosa]
MIFGCKTPGNIWTILSMLPIEVIERVLDYLRGDAKTLAICCLVCQDWSHRARYNMFKTVQLNPGRMMRFFAVIVHHPGLATFVRELTINMPFSMPLALPRNGQMTNLRTLRLNSVDLRDERFLETILHGARSVTEFGLYDCLFATQRDLVRFTQRLPHLKHLALWDPAWALSDPQVAQQPVEDVEFTALRAISIVGCSNYTPSTPHIFCAFLSGSPNGLESLSVLKLELQWFQLRRLWENLTPAAGQLRKLELSVNGVRKRNEAFEQPFPTCVFHKLLMFTLEVRLCNRHYVGPSASPHRPHDPSAHTKWIVPLLTSVRAEDLRLFEFVVRAIHCHDGSYDLACIDWHGIAGVFGQARFAPVRQVGVVVHCCRRGNLGDSGRHVTDATGTRAGVLKEYIRERMGDVERRGILNVRLVGPGM